MTLKSSSISFSDSDDVGSSMIRSLTSIEMAFATSTSCCMPTLRLPAKAFGSMSIPILSKTCAAARVMARQSFSPKAFRFSRRKKMFSVTVAFGTRLSS